MLCFMCDVRGGSDFFCLPIQGGCCRTGPEDVSAIKRAITEYFKTNVTS